LWSLWPHARYEYGGTEIKNTNCLFKNLGGEGDDEVVISTKLSDKTNSFYLWGDNNLQSESSIWKFCISLPALKDT
jgi:hypothetical protein